MLICLLRSQLLLRQQTLDFFSFFPAYTLASIATHPMHSTKAFLLPNPYLYR